MTKDNFKIGQTVSFGRNYGQKTLGKIVKLNRTKAKVEIGESRGNGRGSKIGSVWNVPYEMLVVETPPDPTAPLEPIKLPQEKKLQYNQFNEDNTLLMALFEAYHGLEPENLGCDGERPFAEIQKRRRQLERKLKGIQYALGYNVSERQAFDWYLSKMEAGKSASK